LLVKGKNPPTRADFSIPIKKAESFDRTFSKVRRSRAEPLPPSAEGETFFLRLGMSAGRRQLRTEQNLPHGRFCSVKL